MNRLFNFDRKITFDISYTAFLKIILVAVLFLVLYLVREIILMMFVAIVIASGIDPWIDFLQKRKIPRWVSTLFIFLLLVGILILIIYVLIPPISEQIQQLIQTLPQYFEALSQELGRENLNLLKTETQDIGEVVSSVTSRVGKAAVGTFSNIIGGVISLIVILVLAFYFVVEEDNFKKFIRSITPLRHRPYIDNLVGRLQLQIGKWFRGQLTLGIVVGTFVFIGLKILGVKYALVLALLAGILEIVPYIGPVLSAIPAVLLGLAQSPFLALLIILLYIIIQQLENHFLVPKIMEKVVGLNPLVVILVLLVGAKLAGVLGAILAVPVATAVHVFATDIFEKKDIKDREKLQKEICRVKTEEEIGLTKRELEKQDKVKEEIFRKLKRDSETDKK